MIIATLWVLLLPLFLDSIQSLRFGGILGNFARRAHRLDLTSQKPPLKVLLIVEPTPFNYVCGYANRFKEMLWHMKAAGDEVAVITPDPDPNHPTEFLGYPITSPKGFPLPIYKQVSLSLDFARNIPKIIKSLKPDLVHVSSPSCLVVPTILWARWFNVPLVMSYHTDIAGYAKTYFPRIPNIMEALSHFIVRTIHRFADLTLCTSPQLQSDLRALGVRRVDVWQKGINTEVSECLDCT